MVDNFNQVPPQQPVQPVQPVQPAPIAPAPAPMSDQSMNIVPPEAGKGKPITTLILLVVTAIVFGAVGYYVGSGSGSGSTNDNATTISDETTTPVSRISATSTRSATLDSSLTSPVATTSVSPESATTDSSMTATDVFGTGSNF